MPYRPNAYTRWSFNFPADAFIPTGFVYGVSYALFGIESMSGCILASRAPVGAWEMGKNLYRENPFSDEAVAWFRSSERRPLLIMTPHGLGLLSKRYLIPCGLGLLIHFHAPATRAAAMARRGVLSPQWLISNEVLAHNRGRCDDETYRILREATYELTERLPSLFPSAPERMMQLRDVANGIRRMAVAIGRPIDEASPTDDLPRQAVRCNHPLAFEAFLLYGLSVANRMASCDHAVTFTLNAPHALAPESLSIRLDMELELMHYAHSYTVPTHADAPDSGLEHLFAGCHCLRHASAFNGSVIRSTLGPAILDPANRRRELRHLTLEMTERNDPIFDHRLSMRSNVAEQFGWDDTL